MRGGTAPVAWPSKGVLTVTVPLATMKQGSQPQAHMLFVLGARAPRPCQAKKENFQKETLCGKISAPSI